MVSLDDSGIQLGRISASDICFAKFTEVFPYQNFVPHGIHQCCKRSNNDMVPHGVGLYHISDGIMDKCLCL